MEEAYRSLGGMLSRACHVSRQVNVAAMRVLCSVHGLRPRVAGTPSGTVAALVPGSGELALAGAGSVLQLFDAVRDRHIDRVQVRVSTCGWSVGACSLLSSPFSCLGCCGGSLACRCKQKQCKQAGPW